MKSCKTCGVTKPLSDYYAAKGMTDGHLSVCKECTKARVASRYREKRSDISDYEKLRSLKPERKAKQIEYQRERRRRTAEKEKARRAIAYALSVGKIARKPCEVCGETDSEAHHEDYSKPLDVKWLCFVHHRQLHGQIVTRTKVDRHRKPDLPAHGKRMILPTWLISRTGAATWMNPRQPRRSAAAWPR